MAGIKKKTTLEKKERSQDRRRRLERDRKAKEIAVKYIFPLVVGTGVLLVVLFYLKYGFGGLKN